VILWINDARLPGKLRRRGVSIEGRITYRFVVGRPPSYTLVYRYYYNGSTYSRDEGVDSEGYRHCSWQRLFPFFKLGGRITTTEGVVQLEVCAFNNRDLARDVEEVCRNVNAHGVSLPGGRRLVMAVGQRLRVHAFNGPLAHTG
jgi:hypothetical protein